MNGSNSLSLRIAICGAALAIECLFLSPRVSIADGGSFVESVQNVQPKIVKIYGAGGIQGLEAYQTGILISPEGHVLTAWSYVLDADPVRVILADGRRFTADLVASDPHTEIAVLKLAEVEESLPYFSHNEMRKARTGQRVLAFCNLFGIATGDEAVSVLQGHVAIIAPLEARRGAFTTHYRGRVYVLDAPTNNPGAAGGAVTDLDGHLVGILGKEVRSELTNTWLNFALPIDVVAPVADQIIAGKYTPPPLDEFQRPDRPVRFDQVGIVLVPDVLSRTPPFIDRIIPGSSAEAAGLLPDDLIVAVGQFVPNSCSTAKKLLARTDASEPVQMTVLRGEDLIAVTLKVSDRSGQTSAESN